MAIRFNHTILSSRDAAKTTRFIAEVLGLPPPRRFGIFHVLDLADDVTLDFGDFLGPEDEYEGQHVAFLVSEEEFDAIFARLRARGIPYFADPQKQQPGALNHHFGGRGVYFDDPDGNRLECITRPYAKS